MTNTVSSSLALNPLNKNHARGVLGKAGTQRDVDVGGDDKSQSVSPSAQVLRRRTRVEKKDGYRVAGYEDNPRSVPALFSRAEQRRSATPEANVTRGAGLLPLYSAQT